MNPTLSQEERDEEVLYNKALRVHIDAEIQGLRARGYQTPERTLAFRALQQARHWLGEDLAILGNSYPYPNGVNVTTTIIDPPSDKFPLRGKSS